MSRAEAPGPERAAVFSALGDPTRWALVQRLSVEGVRTLTSLTPPGGLTRQAVAKHLAVLEQAGLVRRSHAGRESRYALRRERLAESQAWLASVSAQWDDAIERLRAQVEGDAAAARALVKGRRRP